MSFVADRYRIVKTVDQKSYVLTADCVVTKKPYSVTIPTQGLFFLRQGMSVAEACPSLNIGDREFLISRTSPEGWDQLFGKESDSHVGKEDADNEIDWTEERLKSYL